MAIAQNYPKIRPSLNLDFANVKALDPRITFARASAATYYGTETAKAEENLFEQSQTWATSPWASINVTVTNNTVDTTAPDGTSTAVKIDLNASTGVAKFVRQAQPSLSNVVVSMFLKAGTHGIVQIYAEGSTGNFCNFDLTGGTVGTAGANATGFIVALANDWYRCIVVFGSAAGNRSYIAAIDSTAAGFAANTTAANVNFFGWGAQREQRDSATNYTPTTTQPITNYIPVLESAAAGEARFDHNPVTGESLGLLIEESRTNACLQSEDFTTTWAVGTGAPTITANIAVAPNGTLTADKLVEGTTNGNQSVAQTNVPFSVGQSSFSVYVKAAERFRFVLRESTSTGAAVLFDVSNGTVITSTGGGTPAPFGLIQFVGNGWYRCTMVLAQSTAANRTVRIIVATNTETSATAANNDRTGDGFSGIFIWGASLEQGAFPTSYVKTTTAQVTRAADAASMTGANFSSFYNQEQGAIYCEYKLPTVLGTSTSRIYSINDNTFANTITLRVNGAGSNQLRPELLINNVSSSLIQVVPDFSVFNKTLFGYKLGDNRAVTNGTIVSTNGTLSPLNPMNRLDIGMAHSITGQINGHIKKFSYYPQRLADAEQGGLTS